MNRIFYRVKPYIPRWLQIVLRRFFIRTQIPRYRSVWPILKGSEKKPEGFTGWPNGKKFALVLTHDVETSLGHKRCRQLLDLEKGLGFRSSFNFVPRRYEVCEDLRNYIRESGFEVGVHDLYHDGKLYSSWEIFSKRSLEINKYLHAWGAKGFRSGSMHRNLTWLTELNIEYDMSTFDTDPFEPQPEGVQSIFPFRVCGRKNSGFVELPYTLPQDFTLFILMKEKNIDIWKRKLDWIVEKEGMALINVHPDYINFEGKNFKYYEYPVDYYLNFLNYVINSYYGQYINLLPVEVASLFKCPNNKGNR